MEGAPSQLDLFDYKPELRARFDQDLPDSIRQGQRLTGMTSGQAALPGGALDLPLQPLRAQPGRRLAQRAAAAHRARSPTSCASCARCTPTQSTTSPASRFFQTGNQQPGRPSLGSWMSYGLGSANSRPAGLRVLISGQGQHAARGTSAAGAAGFLPSEHQGVQLRSRRRPGAVPLRPRRASRATTAGACSTPGRELNERAGRAHGDPEIATRIAQYEMAYRMQMSVPELIDLSDEPEAVLELYGPEPRARARSPPTACWRGAWSSAACASCSSTTAAGTTTATCPTTTSQPLRKRCREIDQPPAALVKDLSAAACSTTRWWSGAASSAARRCTRQGNGSKILRPRPPPALLHDLAGRRRRRGRASVVGADRRVRLQRRSRTRSTCTTCTRRCCTCSASTTSG